MPELLLRHLDLSRGSLVRAGLPELASCRYLETRPLPAGPAAHTTSVCLFPGHMWASLISVPRHLGLHLCTPSEALWLVNGC